MKKNNILIAFVTFIAVLTNSCSKDSPLESGDFAEASFSLSVEFPQTKIGIPISGIEQDRITIYYGDINQTSFQQGHIIGDSLTFNYPVLLKVGNPGRIRATYVDETHVSTIPGTETLADTLYVDSEDPSTLSIAYADDKYNITLNFKHRNALADFAIPDDKEINPTQQIERIFIQTTLSDGTEKTFVDTSSKVILPAGSTLNYCIIFLKNGKEIKAKNNTDIVFEQNKRYPIQITIHPERMSINPIEGIDNWN